MMFEVVYAYTYVYNIFNKKSIYTDFLNKDTYMKNTIKIRLTQSFKIDFQRDFKTRKTSR